MIIIPIYSIENDVQEILINPHRHQHDRPFRLLFFLNNRRREKKKKQSERQ